MQFAPSIAAFALAITAVSAAPQANSPPVYNPATWQPNLGFPGCGWRLANPPPRSQLLLSNSTGSPANPMIDCQRDCLRDPNCLSWSSDNGICNFFSSTLFNLKWGDSPSTPRMRYYDRNCPTLPSTPICGLAASSKFDNKDAVLKRFGVPSVAGVILRKVPDQKACKDECWQSRGCMSYGWAPGSSTCTVMVVPTNWLPPSVSNINGTLPLGDDPQYFWDWNCPINL